MSDSNSPRGEQEQEQKENQMNSSSMMSSISETLDPAQMGISLADLEDDIDVDVVGVSEPEDAGLTNAEIFSVMSTGDVPQVDIGDLSDIWPGPMDLAVYAPVPINSTRILAAPPQAWLPPDDENWIYDFNEEALQDEVYDSDSKVVPLMIGAGLANLGNTCFLNSIMQCFTHTVPLVEGLLLSCHSPNDGHNGFCVICAFRYQMKQSLESTGRVISPAVFVDNLKQFSSDFRRHQQEDAHEFMQCALDKLETCFSNFEEDNTAKKVFGGSLVSKLRCCNCSRSSVTNEPLIDLSLEIENVDSLSSALESFTMVENIDAKLKCEGCNEEVSVEKQLMLDQTPSIAAFHLKRFKTVGNNSVEKIDKHINFPLELDLQPYTILNENNNASLKYDLYAVVVHNGTSSDSGHYFCFVRTAPDTWHKLDDSMVTKVSEGTVLSQEAYILFYAQQGTPWFSSFAESTIPCLNLSRMNTSPKSVLDITDGQDKSFSISNENIERSGAGKSKKNSEKSDYSCQQSRKFPENDDVIDASPCRKQFPAGPLNQKTLHLNGSEDISAQVLPVNYASPTGIAKPGGSSYAENVAPDKSKCSLEANDFIENDVFNALTPPNSPPSQTPGKSFQISRDHLKKEKQGSSGKRSSSGKSSDNPQNKAARAYVRNMPGSRRGAFLDLLGDSPENKRKKTGSSHSDKDSSSARKKSGHASVGSYPVAAGVSQ